MVSATARSSLSLIDTPSVAMMEPLEPPTEGEFVGEVVVGLLVGSSVGCAVGDPLGLTEGKFVGDKELMSVGLAVR